MPARRNFNLSIYTPEGLACEAEVSELRVPAADGMLGILAGHAPMVAMLGAGECSFTAADGTRQQYFLAGGFAHVREDSVSVAAEQCTHMSRLDAEEAWQQLQQARQLPSDTAEAARYRDDAVQAAKAKFALAMEFKRRKMAPAAVEE